MCKDARVYVPHALNQTGRGGIPDGIILKEQRMNVQGHHTPLVLNPQRDIKNDVIPTPQCFVYIDGLGWKGIMSSDSVYSSLNQKHINQMSLMPIAIGWSVY